jgi:hypothetical protein
VPNTLAHLGAQGVLNHLVKRGIDPKLVALGCLLPDVPWILRRLVSWLELSSDPYTTRMYFFAQASLLVTLCLCGSLAFLSQRPRKVFLILGVNSFLHLLLDGLQTKLANGVNFFAPISWNLWNVEWFWPESLPTYILTGCGLLYVMWHWKTAINLPITFPHRSFLSIGLSLTMFLLYFVLPFVFIEGPRQADNQFVRTLQEKDSRIGKPIEFDRRPYIKTSSGDVVEGYGGERIKVATSLLDHSARISGRGKFTAPDEVDFLEIHEHIWGLRNASSILGILLISAMWGQAFFKHWGNRKYIKN